MSQTQLASIKDVTPSGPWLARRLPVCPPPNYGVAVSNGSGMSPKRIPKNVITELVISRPIEAIPLWLNVAAVLALALVPISLIAAIVGFTLFGSASFLLAFLMIWIFGNLVEAKKSKRHRIHKYDIAR